MPIDYTHEHLSTSIMKVDAVHTPIDPSGGVVIQDEGTPQGTTATVDFAGAGVSAAMVGGKAVVTIPGGGGVSVTVSATDPGAIGARNLWVQTDALYPPVLRIRDETNSGWIDQAGASGLELGLVYRDALNRVGATIGGDATGLYIQTLDPATGNQYALLHLGSVGMSMEVDNGNHVLAFSSPAGIFSLDNAPIGTQAAHVADGSTVDQLRDALIASGLMAAS